MNRTLRIHLFSWATMACLCALAGAQDEKEQPPQDASVVKATPAKIKLKKGLAVEGIPFELDNVKVNGLFGQLSIPLQSIAGIHFGDTETTVELNNGDSLTGDVPLSEIRVVTEWGECKVNTPYVASIVFRPGFDWARDGSRWKLRQTANSPANRGNTYYPAQSR